MEDHDDFEFVDNDKSGFEEISDHMLEAEDDDLEAMSDINKEMEDVQELKKHLKSQCMESSKLLKKLKEQSQSQEALEMELKEEIKQISDLKMSLNAERDEFLKKRKELGELLNSMNSGVSNITKTNDLIDELNKFYSETSSIEKEVTKLKSLREQQEEMINQCKINIESMNSNQRDCLVSLDKSKSFACKSCNTDIGLKEDIESKCYQVGQGQFSEKKRGYLFNNAVNTVLGATKTENFTTGSYTISWASCAKCKTELGWKYIAADNPNNSQKIGKYCLARYSLTSPQDRAQQK